MAEFEAVTVLLPGVGESVVGATNEDEVSAVDEVAGTLELAWGVRACVRSQGEGGDGRDRVSWSGKEASSQAILQRRWTRTGADEEAGADEEVESDDDGAAEEDEGASEEDEGVAEAVEEGVSTTAEVLLLNGLVAEAEEEEDAAGSAVCEKTGETRPLVSSLIPIARLLQHARQTNRGWASSPRQGRARRNGGSGGGQRRAAGDDVLPLPETPLGQALGVVAAGVVVRGERDGRKEGG